jgi:hypothetical protein
MDAAELRHGGSSFIVLYQTTHCTRMLLQEPYAKITRLHC